LITLRMYRMRQQTHACGKKGKHHRSRILHAPGLEKKKQVEKMRHSLAQLDALDVD